MIKGVVYLNVADAQNLTDEQDVNLSLIPTGMARHEKSPPYSMSGYTECRYEKAEEEARTAKRGL